MTIVSNGAGQDTTYFIMRCIREPEFRAKHIIEPMVVVGADTGAEHPHTYLNVKLVQAECEKAGILNIWVTPEMGFHSATWTSLYHQYKKNSSIGSAAYRQTCTDNLKVKVVDRFVEDFLKGEMYPGLQRFAPIRKRIFYDFVKWRNDGRKIRLILGFAAGEESRTSNGNKFDAKWKKDCMERYYPLIVDGTDRQAAINWNTANIPWVVWPSNCMICFYSSEQEILWLYRFYPEVFWDWVGMEKAKVQKYNCSLFVNEAGQLVDAGGKVVKNNFVYGKKSLEDKLHDAIAKYGHWSDDELNEYKFSHGHCIKSKM